MGETFMSGAAVIGGINVVKLGFKKIAGWFG
ncbi:hypothetical protein J2S07_003462 [Robertmurraya andreesenii]|uniref:Uncharacterized protein n=1 Tax=Anoxybacillus andreesenii TaxID=1325932 RepID=A0ABT9V846_9BACL|nr:hypothetical protein [Robertmurraya andreesenii]